MKLGTATLRETRIICGGVEIVTAVIIPVLVHPFAYNDLGFVIFLGKKRKLKKRLTFDNLCNIFSNLPCPTKGPFPDRRKFIRSESFKSLHQGQE